MSIKLDKTDEELCQAFYALLSREDIADLLDVKYRDLVYYLYRMPNEKKYDRFKIPKKKDGQREILAPNSSLKILQQKLVQVLSAIYKPKKCVHGFVKNKGIVTNARVHKNQKYVLNIDLEEFFPSINFGRVRGMFGATPYRLAPNLATILAQICCFDKGIPQGAPTSPIISNMICAKMDSELNELARRHKCFYTRYADDITFSTSISNFPSELAYLVGDETHIGEELCEIIQSNGFKINSDKVRLQDANHRQEVTGIIVNEFTNVRRKYIRQIRAMLHAWEKFRLENAQQEYLAKYRKKHRDPRITEDVSFYSVVRGKIEYLRMVRNKENDRIYSQFLKKYRELYKRDVINPTYSSRSLPAEIFISYSRKDEEFVRKLATSLSKLEAKIWLDLDDIPVGMNWSTAIQTGLEECAIMIVVITPDSMASENVTEEWQFFKDEKKPIIPIQLKPANVHYQLRRSQYIDFHKVEYASSFQKLCLELKKNGIILKFLDYLVQF